MSMDMPLQESADALPPFIADHVVAKLSKRTLFGSPVRSRQTWTSAPERQRMFETHRPWARTVFRLNSGSPYVAIELSACPEIACMEVWSVGDEPSRLKGAAIHYGTELFQKVSWLYHRALHPLEDSEEILETYFTLINL